MMKRVKGCGEDGGGSNSISMEEDRISDLPEGLLHRIVYFLSQEDAVRTSLLSKSWRYIWCTRPNFDFSEPNFKGNKHQFISAVENTLQRYTDPNGLSLEEFNLTVSLLGGGDDNHHSDQESVRVLDKWIPIILTTTMGVALKEFRLSIFSPKKLHLSKYPCLVYDLLLIDNKKLHFECLQVVGLEKVLIKQETFDKMMSSCPLLTTLCLEECRGLKTIRLEKKLHKYLKHFTFINQTEYKSTIEIEIDDVPTLETIKIVASMIQFHARHKLNNLKSITLKLPSYRTHEICIDAPNLLYFEYSGTDIPSISFAPNCRRSTITLFIDAFGQGYTVSWLFKVSQLLQALCRSGISLNIDNFRRRRVVMFIPQDGLVPDFVNGGNKPVVVEHLRLRSFYLYSLPSTLSGLLCICHPRNITHPCFKQSNLKKEVAQKKLAEYLCSLVMMRERGKQEMRQHMASLSIQRLERFGKLGLKWQPIQWTGFLECPQLNTIRFQLEWTQF